MQVLDSVPDLDMLAYLPQLLDGLMNMLSDPNREIRVAAEGSMTVGREPEREGWGGMRQGGEGRAILRIDSFELFKSRCWATLPLPVCRVCNSPSRFLWGSTQYPLPTLPHPIFPHLFPHSGVSDGDPHHAHHRLQRPLAHPRGQELQPGVGGGGGGGGGGVGGQRADVQGGMVRIVNQPFPSLASLYICSPSPEPPPSPLPQDEHTRLTALRWLKNFVEMGPSQLVEQYPAILGAVLTNISTSSRDVQQVRGRGGRKRVIGTKCSPRSLPPPSPVLSPSPPPAQPAPLFLLLSLLPPSLPPAGVSRHQCRPAQPAPLRLGLCGHNRHSGHDWARAAQRAGAHSAGGAALGQLLAGEGAGTGEGGVRWVSFLLGRVQAQVRGGEGKWVKFLLKRPEGVEFTFCLKFSPW